MAFSTTHIFPSFHDSHPLTTNQFLTKICPQPYSPNNDVPETSYLRWIGETAGTIAIESIKSIPRANIRDILDTVNVGVCLTKFGTTVASQVSAVAQSPSLLSAGPRLVEAVCKSTAASLGYTLAWAAGFYALHHLPRKLCSLAADSKNPAESLALSKEIKNLTPEAHEAVSKISTILSQQNPQLPQSFITMFATETLLGNWQINHAFEQFNSAAPGEYTDIIEETQNHLPVDLSASFETALRTIDIDQIKQILPKLPLNLQNRTKDLLDTRTCRNLTSFISRAIREKRNFTTEFESQYIEKWTKEYANLHDIDAGPFLIGTNHKPLIHLMHNAIQGFAREWVTPLLNIESVPVEEMPPARFAKKLEQQLLIELNKQHDYKMHDIQNIPQNGRAILAFNHSLFTLDMPMALQAIREHHRRESNLVIDEALMSIPIVNGVLQAIGYRLGEKSTFMRLLSKEKLMAVAPGGANEAFKLYEEANTLRWKKAKGFVRAHLVSGAPLINIMSPQADQLRKNLLSPPLHWLQQNIFDRVKVPIIPVFFAPNAREKVRVDHYVSKPFEAPPMPVNNLSNNDIRFREHINKTHAMISDSAQTLLTKKAQEVRAETIDGSYPLSAAGQAEIAMKSKRQH